MSWARLMPAVAVPSSQATLKGVPPACHSDIQVRLVVGCGLRAGEPYSWPLIVLTQRDTFGAASTACVYLVSGDQPVASQHTIESGRPDWRTIGPSTPSKSVTWPGSSRIDA